MIYLFMSSFALGPFHQGLIKVFCYLVLKKKVETTMFLQNRENTCNFFYYYLELMEQLMENVDNTL